MKIKNLLPYIKWGKEIIIYLVILQVEQRNFHQQKNETIYHVNINRIVVSSKVTFGRKGSFW